MTLPSSALPTLEDLHSKARLSCAVFPNKYVALESNRLHSCSDGQINAESGVVVSPPYIGPDADRQLVQEMKEMLIEGRDIFHCSR